jgi:hypothetical protein
LVVLADTDWTGNAMTQPTDLKPLSKEERDRLRIAQGGLGIPMLRALHTIDMMEARQNKLVEVLKPLVKAYREFMDSAIDQNNQTWMHPNPKWDLAVDVAVEDWAAAAEALREIESST